MDLVPSPEVAATLVVRSFRYRVRPTARQHIELERILELQRQLYNAALQERIDAWRKAEVKISRYKQHESLTLIRAEDPSYRGLPVVVSRWTLNRLDEAYEAFHRRRREKQGRAGFPRFRSKARWDSFGFAEWSGVRLVGHRLHFKGLSGGLKVRLHRPLPGRRILSGTLHRDAKGWSLSVQLRVPVNPLPHAGTAIGLDLGVESLAVTSDGEFIPNPRIGRRHYCDLRRQQRALARCPRDSHGRRKQRRQLARVHRRIVNSRKDHLHKTSGTLVKAHALIAVEKLQIRNLTASARGTVETPGIHVKQKAALNRSIQDASWGRFLTLLRYKAENAGTQIVEVEANHSSQDCSGCGARVPKALAERWHACPHCGLSIHRDLNAARNLLHRAGRGPGRQNVAP